MIEDPGYQAVLSDLESKRAQIDAAITHLKIVMQLAVESGGVEPGQAPPLTAGSVQTAIHPDTFFGLSFIEAAKKYLKMARRAQHTTAIADAIAKGGLKRPTESTLSSLLIRAAKGREVMKVGKAMWGLAEWYPKAPKESNGEVGRRATRAGRRRARKSAATAPTVAPKKKESTETAAPESSQGGKGPVLSPMMLDVLREAGKPLHTKEITSRVNARGNAATKATIEGLLRRWVKQGKVRKAGPSTFAL
jgi:hypothetical protein